MTEEEWAGSEGPHFYRAHLSRYCVRKQRLFACACARRYPDDDTPQFRHAVEMVERVADSNEPLETLRALRTRFKPNPDDSGPSHALHPLCNPDASWAAASTVWACAGAVASQAMQGRRLMGDGFGVEYARHRGGELAILWHILGCVAGPPGMLTMDPAWRSETAVALAAGIYAERAFDRLPILADALEEAGCDHPDILAHCRGPGPHARGCWVVDGVLGKV